MSDNEAGPSRAGRLSSSLIKQDHEDGNDIMSGYH
jgi:hypothetical protein